MIVNFHSVVTFRPETAKTILLTLNSALCSPLENVPIENFKWTIVSETRTQRFKLWMDR